MKPVILLLGLTLAVTGCSQLAMQEASPLATPIAPAEVEWSRKNGANTVSGTAAITAAGVTHTCSGQSANLIPDTPYARARMTAIFGNASQGMRAAAVGAVKFDRDDPLYVSSLRTTRCDASGSFSFPRVPDGVWYVTTSVKWGTAEGGSVMQRVDVRGGRLVKVTLP